MRRKSKKAREESKVDSSSEKRSKRSSTRRKKTFDEDEGGSGAEEGRTTEEETNQSKVRSSRRYATRGRRQKVEESEEEESPIEEEVECDEESSNTYPAQAEADDGVQAADSDEDSDKGVKTESGVADADTVSGGIDETSECNSDNQYWEMKSGKEEQDDKRGETFAHGDRDDGEEEVSRTHSRKKKLKLSRECLQENREAIPKIRLRLSRNRSGGYETEKVEAERIDSSGGVEPAVEVLKVESIPEETEDKECDQSSEPSEPTEVGVVESPPVEEVITKSDTVETEVVEPDSGLSGSAEMAEAESESHQSKDEVVDKESTDEVLPDSIDVNKELKEEVSPQSNEEADSCAVETAQATSSDSSPIVEEKAVDFNQMTNEAEKLAQVSDSEKMEVEDSSAVEEKEEVSSVPIEEKRASDEDEGEVEDERAVEGKRAVEDETAVEAETVAEVETVVEDETATEVETAAEVETAVEDEGAVCKDVGGIDATEVNEERRAEEAVGDDGNDQVSTTNDVKDAKKDESEGKEVAEDNVEVPVGGAKDEGMEVEKEGSDDKEDAKEEGSSAPDEVSVPKVAENDSSEEKEEVEKKSEENNGEEVSDVHKKEEESHQKGGSGGERVSRINRSRLRQEDDRDEESPSQKRRAKVVKRSVSGGEESSSASNAVKQPAVVAAPDQPQPKRVTLKRPRLIRATSSSSSKEKDDDGKDRPVDASGTQSNEMKDDEKTEARASEDNKEDIHEDAVSHEPQSVAEDEGVKKKRRRWGQNKSQSGPSHSRRAFISISSQSLKGLIPEVKPLPIHELRLSIEKDDVKDICMDEEESCDALADETIVRMIDTNGQNERTVWAQVVDDEMRPTVHPEVPRVPTVGGGDMNVSTGPVRRISIVSDDAVRLQRSPSPPRHPPSNVLFLSNLVRPFTVQQLKELLARTGTVVEDGFWIDRIKSMCLVQYETEEQARETRHALHGVRWPISNPKRLWVDFSTKEKLEEAKRDGNAPALPTASGPSLSPPHSTLRDDFPRKTEPLRMEGSGLAPTHPSHRVSPGQPGHSVQGPVSGASQVRDGDGDSAGWQQRGRPRPEPPPLRPGANARDFKMSAPVREWDLDKVVQQSPPRPGVHGPLHGGAVDDRRRPDAAGQPGSHRDRIMPSPPASMQDLQARKAKRKEAEAAAAAAAEAPANLLDSLFRKTKATPSIYWLPLTADQIKVKEEIRRQHLAEHERRMAEMKRAAAKERAGRRRRRSSSPRRRSRRRSGDDSGAVRKRPSESIKGRKAGSASPKK